MNKYIILLSIFLATNVYAQDTKLIVDAIYHAEGGQKAKKPYGILSIPCNSEQECRRICENTVNNQKKRHAKHNCGKSFLLCLRDRYAPLEADNDPTGLNSNWLKNVKWFIVNPKEVR